MINISRVSKWSILMFMGLIIVVACSGKKESLENTLKPGEYTDFSQKRVAVIAAAPGTMQYHSELEPMTRNIIRQLGLNYEDIEILSYPEIEAFVKERPLWMAMPPSHTLKALELDRLIVLDVAEFRPYAPGDPNVMRGMSTVNVRVLEAQEGIDIDPDRYAYSQQVQVNFPGGGAGLPASIQLTHDIVSQGLRERVVQRVAMILSPDPEED